jgi:hypothetical protein
MNRDVKGYEGLYFVNELGEVFSYPKKTRKGIRKLLLNKHKQGYLLIDLCKNGKIKKHLVHRLVAEAFLENPLNKKQVNHINGIKNDNSLKNLEWNTSSENQLHSIRIGLRSTKGSKNSQSKLTEQEVLYIRNSKEIGSVLCKQFNISHPTICDIRKYRSWKHI